jgi:hypothetical protein
MMILITGYNIGNAEMRVDLHNLYLRMLKRDLFMSIRWSNLKTIEVLAPMRRVCSMVTRGQGGHEEELGGRWEVKS